MLHRYWTTLLATVAFVAVPVLASAQGSNPSDGGDDTTHYDFEKDEVEGSLHGPSEERVRGTLPERLESLIEVRSEFVDRVRATVTDL